MKKFIKIVALVLCISVSLVAFVGCGGQKVTQEEWSDSIAKLSAVSVDSEDPANFTVIYSAQVGSKIITVEAKFADNKAYVKSGNIEAYVGFEDNKYFTYAKVGETWIKTQTDKIAADKSLDMVGDAFETIAEFKAEYEFFEYKNGEYIYSADKIKDKINQITEQFGTIETAELKLKFSNKMFSKLSMSVSATILDQSFSMQTSVEIINYGKTKITLPTV